MVTEVLLPFDCSPVYEGIKTNNPLSYCSRLFRLTVALFTKGLRRKLRKDPSLGEGFDCSPVYEGIKTLR